MPVWVWIVLCLFSSLFAVKLLFVACTGWSMRTTRGAIFVPAHRESIEALLEAVPMEPGDVFVDLGCGDGRVLRAVRKRYRVEARGVDVNPLACWMARLRNLFDGKVRIHRADFWGHDVGDAGVLFCYLFPDVMERMARKLAGELRTGSRVVSANFPLPGWTPVEVVRPASPGRGDPIFIYHVPDDPGSDRPAGARGSGRSSNAPGRSPP